jgi:hypothetical protein
VAHLELNLAPATEDMPDMALALIRAVAAAADKDQDGTGMAQRTLQRAGTDWSALHREAR